MATAESTRAGWLDLFERPLHRQRVHHRRQHADRVGARALDPLIRALESAKEIAAADDNRDLHTKVRRRLEIAGDALKSRRVQAMRVRAHQRLARQLDDNALE